MKYFNKYLNAIPFCMVWEWNDYIWNPSSTLLPIVSRFIVSLRPAWSSPNANETVQGNALWHQAYNKLNGDIEKCAVQEQLWKWRISTNKKQIAKNETKENKTIYNMHLIDGFPNDYIIITW